MSLELDERRVAMLREMGLHLLPPIAVPSAPAPAAEPAAEPATARAPAAAVDEAVAPPQAPVRAQPAPRAAPDAAVPLAPEVQGIAPGSRSWLVFCEAVGDEDGGDAGKLLDNMLRAIGLDRRRDVAVVQVPAPRSVARGDSAGEADGAAWLRRQLAQVQPRVVLAMGRGTVQALLQTQEPVGKLRGRVHDCDGVPVVVTYHPAYLLRNLADKAKAWADLCHAAQVVAGQAQGPASGS